MNVLNKPINVRLTKLSQKVVQFAGISLLSFALPVSATEISKNSMNVLSKENNNFFISSAIKLEENSSSLFIQKKITGTVFDWSGET